MREVAQFSFSTDGERFQNLGESFTMVYQGLTFQGVRYALFNYNVNRENGGYADFDSINISEPSPHGLTRPIPYGKQIELVMHNRQPEMRLASSANSLFASPKLSTTFIVVDRGLGRVALRTPEGFVSVDQSGIVLLRSGVLGDSETFQWIETFTGELVLLSLESLSFCQCPGRYRTRLRFATQPEAPLQPCRHQRMGRRHRSPFPVRYASHLA